MLSLLRKLICVYGISYLVGMVTSGILSVASDYSELYDLILIPFVKGYVLMKIKKYVYFGYVAVLLLYYYLTGPTYYHSDYFGGF